MSGRRPVVRHDAERRDGDRRSIPLPRSWCQFGRVLRPLGWPFLRLVLSKRSSVCSFSASGRKFAPLSCFRLFQAPRRAASSGRHCRGRRAATGRGGTRRRATASPSRRGLPVRCDDDRSVIASTGTADPVRSPGAFRRATSRHRTWCESGSSASRATAIRRSSSYTTGNIPADASALTASPPSVAGRVRAGTSPARPASSLSRPAGRGPRSLLFRLLFLRRLL